MKILLIEDEVKLAQAIQKGLSRHEYVVHVVHNAAEAKIMALREEYAVIVSDIIMPGQSGVELLAELRREGCQTPVLLLTALGQIEDKELGFEAGADDYLTKPFEFKELLMRVRALARRTANFSARNEQAAVLRYASLELRHTSKEVLR